MIFFTALMLAVSILMPLAFAVRVWRLRETSRAGWILVSADAAVFVTLLLLVSRWDIAGLYTRIGLAVIFLAAVGISWRRHAHLPFRSDGFVRRHWATVGSLVLFSAALLYVACGLLDRRDAHALAFPLEDGRFVVAHGGCIGLLNHHSGHRAQRHAVDITVVGPWGFRADGILPETLHSYAIFGRRVVSPCDGVVTAAVDGLPDLTPPQRDPDPANAAGNHVVISCGGLSVELAHLRQGSVTVAEAQTVVARQTLGEVGNSGNTTEPHLHVHAVDPATGEGVRLSFDGRAPLRNRVYRR